MKTNIEEQVQDIRIFLDGFFMKLIKTAKTIKKNNKLKTPDNPK